MLAGPAGQGPASAALGFSTWQPKALKGGGGQRPAFAASSSLSARRQAPMNRSTSVLSSGAP